jgi:hypothetical protein
MIEMGGGDRCETNSHNTFSVRIGFLGAWRLPRQSLPERYQ